MTAIGPTGTAATARRGRIGSTIARVRLAQTPRMTVTRPSDPGIRRAGAGLP